jgi:hypothetical protein
MDTSDSLTGPSNGVLPQSQAGTSMVPPSGVSRSAALQFAVTPFNPNPRTPKAVEVVAKLQKDCPWLEGGSPSRTDVSSSHALAPVEELPLVLRAEEVQQGVPSSEHVRSPGTLMCRPARGRVHTMARPTPRAAQLGGWFRVTYGAARCDHWLAIARAI